MKEYNHKKIEKKWQKEWEDKKLYKVKDVVNGYEHREHMSPRLCYNHACGWNISYTNLDYGRRYALLGLNRSIVSDKLEMRRTLFEEPVLSDEEVDLHFAQYLAKQLQKTIRENT